MKTFQKKYSYRILPMECDAEQEHIVGEIYVPKKMGKHPIVIFSHALCHTRTSGADYAKILAEQGCAVCLFDFRGGSAESASEGSPKNMSIVTERKDIHAVVKHIKELSFVNEKKIALLGASQGGVVAFLEAHRHPEDICGLIMLYPAFVISDVVHYDFKSFKEITDDYFFRQWIWVGRRYAEDIWNIDFEKSMKDYKRPVLILHGDSDPLIPSWRSEEIAKNFKDARFHVIKKGRHGFKYESLFDAMEYILDFLKELKFM